MMKYKNKTKQFMYARKKHAWKGRVAGSILLGTKPVWTVRNRVVNGKTLDQGRPSIMARALNENWIVRDFYILYD